MWIGNVKFTISQTHERNMLERKRKHTWSTFSITKHSKTSLHIIYYFFFLGHQPCQKHLRLRWACQVKWDGHKAKGTCLSVTLPTHINSQKKPADVRAEQDEQHSSLQAQVNRAGIDKPALKCQLRSHSHECRMRHPLICLANSNSTMGLKKHLVLRRGFRVRWRNCCRL